MAVISAGMTAEIWTKEKALLEGCVPNIAFNEETVFPEEMSDTFPAKEYLEAGAPDWCGKPCMNRGITGKGRICRGDRTGPLYRTSGICVQLALIMHVTPNQTGSMLPRFASLSVETAAGVARCEAVLGIG